MSRHTHPGWYAGAVGAVALALAASSGQLFTVALPTLYHTAHTGKGTEFVHLDQTVMQERTPNEIAVDVAVTAVAPVQERFVPEVTSGESVRMWAVDLTFRADPDVPLRYCDISVFSDDDEYAPVNVVTGLKTELGLGSTGGCIPNDAPGPDRKGANFLNIDLDSASSGEQVQHTDDIYDGPRRPEEYTVTSYVIMPPGVEPTEVRVAWQEPDYIQITDLEVSTARVPYHEPPQIWTPDF